MGGETELFYIYFLNKWKIIIKEREAVNMRGFN